MKRITALIISLFIISLIFPACFFVNAADSSGTIRKTLDLASLYRNDSGSGYDWNNIDKQLVLKGLRIETDDEIGLKVPADAVITLEGDNYVKASSCAMTCVTSLTIKGTGTLTLIADDIGIRCYSLSSGDILRIREGKITVTSGGYGVFSEYASVHFAGGETTFVGCDTSVKAGSVRFTDGKHSLEGAVNSNEKIVIAGGDIAVGASISALNAKRAVETSGGRLFVGTSADNVSEAEAYAGENYIRFKGDAKKSGGSVLFGEKVPKAFDHVALVVLILGAAAVIAVPLIIKKKKTAKLIGKSAPARETGGEAGGKSGKVSK